MKILGTKNVFNYITNELDTGYVYAGMSNETKPTEYDVCTYYELDTGKCYMSVESGTWYEIATSGGGGGGTSDYNELSNLPKINSVEIKGNVPLSDIGAYEKPDDGIPMEDLDNDVADSIEKNDSGYYKRINKISDYLYETWYDSIDYEYANEYLESQNTPDPVGGCSCVRNGNFYGRNFDWMYDDYVEFIVHTPSAYGRYASVAVAKSVDGLTKTFVESGETNQSYKFVPFSVVDGINEYGLTCNANVVPASDENTDSIPSVSVRERVNERILIRYILDNFKTAYDAVDYISKYVSVHFDEQRKLQGYDMHWMIADKDDTYVLEFVDNTAVIIDGNEDLPVPAMTNFVLSGVEFNNDGSVYTPYTQDDEHDASTTNKIGDKGAGLERWNSIVSGYSTASTKAGMRTLMNSILYTNAYTKTVDAEKWFTEYAGVGSLTVASPYESFSTVYEAGMQAYTDRTRDDELKTWQTVHSVVYDIDNCVMHIIVQEDTNDEKELNGDKHPVDISIADNLTTNDPNVALSAKQGVVIKQLIDDVEDEIADKQDVSNIVTTLDSASTDTQYPSAKCVYDIIGNIETLLGGLL